ncbi:MAG: hypothetical protein WDM91_04505 [Rhizomicrobium sp.]
MKRIVAGISLVVVLVMAGAPAADAKGCIKGAIVGGIAGHYMHHHGLIGAMAGCAVGRHLAAKHDAERRAAQHGHH